MPQFRNIGLCSLTHYRFPLTAITSILHRISGFLLVLSIPFLLGVLMLSLRSKPDFADVKSFFNCPVMRFFFWAFLSLLAYHVVAGIKHLLLDMGHFETKRAAKISSIIVLLIAAVLVILLGVWIW